LPDIGIVAHTPTLRIERGTIYATGISDKSAVLRVVDTRGRVAVSKNFSRSFLTLDMAAHRSPGMYVVTVADSKGKELLRSRAMILR
jgi:hypothetical protein